MAQLEIMYVLRFQLENDAITNRNHPTTDTIRRRRTEGVGTTLHSFLFLVSKIRRRHRHQPYGQTTVTFRLWLDDVSNSNKKMTQSVQFINAFLLLLVYYKRITICPAIYYQSVLIFLKKPLCLVLRSAHNVVFVCFLSAKTLSDIKNHHISETTDKSATLPPFSTLKVEAE